MAIVKSEAIILHTAKMGETSKRLKLYSRRNGVLTLIAKGARSPKSRLGGMLETLYVVEVVFTKRKAATCSFSARCRCCLPPNAC